MNFFETLMWPIHIVIEAILFAFHWIFQQIGMDPASGGIWLLSILCLVLIVRTAILPLTVRQLKSSRKAMEIAPEMKKIQDKYRGKKDQFSREAMNREMMELYQRTGTNPMASCLPMLVQFPIFIGLVQVLNRATQGQAGVGLMTEELAQQFRSATALDVIPLYMNLQEAFAQQHWPVIIAGVLLTIVMIGSQFFTTWQMMTKNATPQMRESPMYKQQRILLYIFPLMLLVSAWLFPIAMMWYWFISNIYTLVQQQIIMSRMPNPGSEAALAREARMARKRQRMGLEPAEAEEVQDNVIVDLQTQRSQPRRKKPRAER